jgi:uncharacterized protein (TIGR03435 family)
MNRVTMSALALVCSVVSARAQTDTEKPMLKFEVASIKINTTTTNGNRSLNRHDGGILDCSNVPLRMLVQFAYGKRDYEILGLPGWADTEPYDILAKPTTEESAKEPAGFGKGNDNLKLRTQSLLADRFGMVSHMETREGSIYKLVVAKGGTKLTPTVTEVGPQSTWNNIRILCKRITMKQFAEGVLSAKMGHPVIDATDVDGLFDFEVKFAPDEMTAGGIKSLPDNANALNDSGAPTFFVAIQQQLGLKLEPAKGPVQYLVIDHVERPSAN